MRHSGQFQHFIGFLFSSLEADHVNMPHFLGISYNPIRTACIWLCGCSSRVHGRKWEGFKWIQTSRQSKILSQEEHDTLSPGKKDRTTVALNDPDILFKVRKVGHVIRLCIVHGTSFAWEARSVQDAESISTRHFSKISL